MNTNIDTLTWHCAQDKTDQFKLSQASLYGQKSVSAFAVQSLGGQTVVRGQPILQSDHLPATYPPSTAGHFVSGTASLILLPQSSSVASFGHHLWPPVNSEFRDTSDKATTIYFFLYIYICFPAIFKVGSCWGANGLCRRSARVSSTAVPHGALRKPAGTVTGRLVWNILQGVQSFFLLSLHGYSQEQALWLCGQAPELWLDQFPNRSKSASSQLRTVAGLPYRTHDTGLSSFHWGRQPLLRRYPNWFKFDLGKNIKYFAYAVLPLPLRLTWSVSGQSAGYCLWVAGLPYRTPYDIFTAGRRPLLRFPRNWF